MHIHEVVVVAVIVVVVMVVVVVRSTKWDTQITATLHWIWFCTTQNSYKSRGLTFKWGACGVNVFSSELSISCIDLLKEDILGCWDGVFVMGQASKDKIFHTENDAPAFSRKALWAKGSLKIHLLSKTTSNETTRLPGLKPLMTVSTNASPSSLFS